jgi:hypothetical protein
MESQVPLPNNEILEIPVWLLKTKIFPWTGPRIIGVNVTVKVQEAAGARMAFEQLSSLKRLKEFEYSVRNGG